MCCGGGVLFESKARPSLVLAELCNIMYRTKYYLLTDLVVCEDEVPPPVRRGVGPAGVQEVGVEEEGVPRLCDGGDRGAAQPLHLPQPGRRHREQVAPPCVIQSPQPVRTWSQKCKAQTASWCDQSWLSSLSPGRSLRHPLAGWVACSGMLILPQSGNSKPFW